MAHSVCTWTAFVTSVGWKHSHALFALASFIGHGGCRSDAFALTQAFISGTIYMHLNTHRLELEYEALIFGLQVGSDPLVMLM